MQREEVAVQALCVGTAATLALFFSHRTYSVGELCNLFNVLSLSQTSNSLTVNESPRDSQSVTR